MEVPVKQPGVESRPATGRNSSKIGWLRTAAAISSALCILVSLIWTDVTDGLIFGLVGVVLAARDMRTPQGKSAGRQVLVFSIVALVVVLFLWIAKYLVGGSLSAIFALIGGLGAWAALYLAGYLRPGEPKAEIGQDETSVATGAKQRHPRLLMGAAALLTGLSNGIPSVMMAFVYPINGAQYYYGRGPYGQAWVGETWWPLVFAAAALSIGCAFTGVMLVGRSRVPAAGTNETRIARAPHRVAQVAGWLLPIALLAFMLAPIMTFFVTSPLPDDYARTGQWIYPERFNNALGGGLVGLGLACIGLAVWGMWVSDPAATRRWFRPLCVAAFLLAILGNAFMFLLFAFIGVSL